MRAAASAWSLGWCMGIAVTNLFAGGLNEAVLIEGVGFGRYRGEEYG